MAKKKLFKKQKLSKKDIQSVKNLFISSISAGIVELSKKKKLSKKDIQSVKDLFTSLISVGIVELGKLGLGLGIVSSDFRPPDPSWKKKEFHAPGYNFLGPGTNYKERIKRGDKPVNFLDECAMIHDGVYVRNDLTIEEIMEADLKFLDCINSEKAQGLEIFFQFIAIQIFEGKKELIKRGLINPRLFTGSK